MNRKTLAACAAAALALPLTVAAPASAAVVTVVDGDDSTIAADVHRVRLAHNPKNVRVRITFDELYRSSDIGQGMSVYLDTDRRDPGPEFRLVSGLNAGTDYTFESVTRWAGPGEVVTNCTYRLRLNWKKDVATFTAARKCLGRPKRVAVAVHASENLPDGSSASDWMTGRRVFSPSVKVG